MVQNPGNVPFAVISYIRRDWKRSCHWDDFSLDHQKISNKKPFTEKKISITPKTFNKGQIYGGSIFGFGWAITGACPGPLFEQIGTGAFEVIITLVSAVLGT